ncbi:M64 family metallopeptidase [Cognataquiflexum rubidum]|uniref:M64 family metallopeptidase n=1 Tax=Cognataquiflexum rubidum TaxID=2922273 RepID=UPI001F139144|nr:M64 family metallopeptidase [Cognataquiflexum rubidum]MCH6232378.1 M64 family metallo-endopeptidase [Cognataquiflexum rubidum]
MEKFYIKDFKAFIALLLFLIYSQSQAQLMPMEIIHYSGSPNEVTNIVIVGDGYTASQQDKFLSDAKNATAGMLAQPPWRNYRNGINVYAIKVNSNVSGAAQNPNNLIDNYFGSSYWSFNIERLLVAWRSQKLSSVLFTNTPFFDIGVLVVNDPKYGGSGGAFAIFSTHSSATEIMIHELGHSFGDLADEYWAGPQYARERHNMTQNTNPQTIRWKDFLNRNGIGIYPHAESPTWQRPHQNCKMRFLGRSFCDVCSHQLEGRLKFLSTPDSPSRPTALFGANKLEIKPAEKVKFIDLSTSNPTSWEWTFEGGIPEVSNEKNPEVSYRTQGKYKVTLKARNNLGENVFSREEFIKVTAPFPDRTPPVLVTKNITIDLDEKGEATVCAEDVDEGTYDDVELVKISISRENFTCADIGKNKVIFKAKDASGNESQREVIVTVDDKIKPTIKAKDFEIFVNYEGTAVLIPKEVDNGSFDNCEIKEMTLSKTEFTRNDAGENKVVFTIYDSCDNSASVEITVTVNIILTEEEALSNGLKLYPNPADDIVYIEYLKLIDHQLESIEILDINGRILRSISSFEKNVNVIPIDVKGFHLGQYYIILKSQKTFKTLRFSIVR